MPRWIRTCLAFLILAILGSILCLGVWTVGIYVFGLPSLTDQVGEPSTDLPRAQEVGLGLYLYARRGALDSPAGDSGAVLELQVVPGESASEVIENLAQANVVHDANLLRLYLRYRGLDRGIEAGNYVLDGSMSIRELAASLQSASDASIIITIPEGWRREQIAASIASEVPGTSEADFLAATQSIPPGYSFSDDSPAGATLEGFLFPETYQLDPNGTADNLVERMLQTFEMRIDEPLRQAFRNQGLDVYQAVTLASIVEREAIVPEERPRIAAVFLNRLAAGMSLDADPTIQYALGQQPDGSWWKLTLTFDDLELPSPYNTYLFQGLPPGPIANPGLSSLEAVGYPADTSELYFRALCDGSGRHAFAETFEQHLQNACP
ncbi:MAG: endolytic transglycosylase MltG [Anaerolineales bacterium]